jgi:hypothetical protein
MLPVLRASVVLGSMGIRQNDRILRRLHVRRFRVGQLRGVQLREQRFGFGERDAALAVVQLQDADLTVGLPDDGGPVRQKARVARV